MRATATLAVMGAGALWLAGLAGAGARPALRTVSGPPLTLAGSSFVPGENVTLLLTGTAHPLTRKAVASDAGSFLVHFPAPSAQGRMLRIRAIGSAGSAAIWAPRANRTAPPASSTR